MNIDDLNLESMDAHELGEIQRRVDNAIATLEERRKKEALQAVQDIAAQYGISVNELLEAQGKKKGKKPVHPPKYRNPDDPDQTWSGLGRKPQWLLRAEEDGKTKEDFAI